MAIVEPSQGYLDSKHVKDARILVSELCRHFYALGWVLGTGGSISIKVHDDSFSSSRQLIVMSPSGVQKERMVPEDIFVLSHDGLILLTPPLKSYPLFPPKCTDCAPLFMKVYEMRNAGAVIHSHGMESCLVTMIHPSSKTFRITHMEMIKGIQGHGYHDELVVPIIENAAHERELIESLTEAISSYPKTTAVLVRNHGVYIWGDSWISAKTQAECYHYLFDAAIKLHQLGLDWSTPNHGVIRNVNGDLKAGSLNLDYAIKPAKRCILLGIEGITTPLSFLTDILLPYVIGKVEKHLVSTYDNQETQDDIALLHTQIKEEVEHGAVGAVPLPPDCVGIDMVIASLVANVEAMISAERESAALKQLQAHIWRYGFQSNELVGIVYDDVPEALERWHASGLKVYIYSSTSREIQQFLFGRSNFGNLRKYISGFFDSSVGNKNETKAYIDILKTVGVEKAADMLFVTDVLSEAVAAKSAGLEVMISIRPGNRPLLKDHGFHMIHSLLEI